MTPRDRHGTAAHAHIVAALLASVLGLGAACAPPAADAPTAAEVILPEGGPIELTDQDRQRFALADHRGDVVVLFFGYTSCPDYCPAAMAQMSRVVSRLGDDGRHVLTAFISVDPDRDTPEILKAYVGNFRLRAVGLTGDPDAVDDVVRRYGATYEIVDDGSAMGPQVHHSTQLAIIDREGRLRRLIAHDTETDRIVRAIQELL